jgi:hypothetical protein
MPFPASAFSYTNNKKLFSILNAKRSAPKREQTTSFIFCGSW